MKRVISFSLWGDNPTYNIGAIKNAELAKIYYPDFECWFYVHKETVPQLTITTIEQIGNSMIIYKEGNLNECKPMTWRFEAIDEENVEIMMSRDTDTRIWEREVLAVREWLNSDKIFHIMRDHPHHEFYILGGMFGTKKIPEIKSWSEYINHIYQYSPKMYDQDFLRDIIYPLIKDRSFVHANFFKYENNSKNFPIPYNNEFNFVGEYVYSDESRSLPHINDLKKQLNI
jgi:protein O-GlcNAc transferase